MWDMTRFFQNRIYSVLNEDHDDLFTSLTGLKTLVGDGGEDDRQACLHGLAGLVDDVLLHFRREDALMKAFGFPGLDEHRNTHLALLRTIQTYHSKLDHERQPLSVEEVEYLEAWLTDHVRYDDRKIEDYLTTHPLIADHLNRSAKDVKLLGPHALAFGIHKIALWAKLYFFRHPMGVASSNRERALRNGESGGDRLRRMGHGSSASSKHRQEENTRNYNGWYYGNY